ncbi:MAG: hypothetical protein HYU66_01460 [Armatimonadetes bacterium]|nr:hypothetical protein [Armatimonadota bacterium]
MSAAIEWPAGDDVEIEFLTEGKANQRGILARGFDPECPGFEFHQAHVPESLGFHEPFRVEFVRKWLSLATVSEIRYLPEGALRAEIERMERLHAEVQRRMEQR